jgi:hypothetical protein
MGNSGFTITISCVFFNIPKASFTVRAVGIASSFVFSTRTSFSSASLAQVKHLKWSVLDAYFAE